MISLKQIMAGALLALFVQTAIPHPNHGDEAPIGKKDAPARAERAVMVLVEAKKLAPSWVQKQFKEVSTRQSSAGTVWVVTYANPKEVDATKTTLYIFLDEFGNFMGGNHSGKL